MTVRPIIYWYLFFCVLPSIASAQSPDQLMTTGDSLRQAGWYAQSTLHLQQAAIGYQQQTQWKPYVHCLVLLSANYADIQEFEYAQKYAEEAVAYSRHQLSDQGNEVSRAYLALSNAFIYQEQYDSARLYYRSAMAHQANQNGSLLVAAQTFGTLGRIFSGLHYTDSAKYCYKKAIALLKDSAQRYPLTLADLYLRLGTCYGDQYYYDSATHYYRVALALLEEVKKSPHPIIVRIHQNMAIDFYAKFDFDQSLVHFLKALEVRQHFFEDDHQTAQYYRDIGVAYQQKRAFAQAQRYFSQAVSLLEASGNKASLTAAYFSLGTNANRNSNFSLGKTSLQKALNTWQESNDQDSTFLYRILNSMAVGYEEANKIDSAMIYFQKALTVAQQATQKNWASISIYHYNVGETYLIQNQPDQALSHAQQALSIRASIFGKKHPKVASAWRLLGDIYAKQGNRIESLHSFQQALITNVLDFADTAVWMLPQASSDYLDAYELLEALYAKAKILLAPSSTPDESKAALAALYLSDTIIERLQQSYQTHDDKVTLRASAKVAYQLAIEANVRLFRKENDPTYLQQAFYFSEKSKATVLTHALAEVSAQHQAGIPDSLLAQERALSIDRAYYTSRIQTEKSNSKPDSSVLRYCQNRLFTINLQYDALIQQLEAQHPRYYKLKYRNPIITVSQLQQQLTENTTLVSSFLGDSTIYQFVVTPDTLRLVVQPYDSTLLENVAQLRSTLTPEAIAGLSQDTYHTFTKSASFLYQTLLNSALSFGTATEINHPARLIIIADDMLGYVPFDVLLTRPIAGQVPDYRSLPYLLKRYNISYGYSATWLFQPSVKSTAEASRELVAFASSPTDLSTNQLVWNQTEVDKVSHHVTTQSYTGLQAQEHRFKTEAEQYRLIHLAMHGYADERDPLESRIVFSPTEGDYEDNILYAHELYDMQLSADLAVLSACQTGDGALAEGEGILSLARAFAYAGCASVVMSHWAADDESTATLMDYFYRYLAEGKPKDQALSEAKRTFLSETRADFTHPYYWANFMLVGNANPIITNSANHTIYLVLIGMALVVAVIAVIKIKI